MAMALSHRFTVPTGVEQTWAHFQDVASVAECFPGAAVTTADGDTFAGSVKVRLGPIALVYTGSGTFVEKDSTAHRFVVDARGKDKRGNGTAGAHVTVAMTEDGGSTAVVVDTDLSITGKPAQFGRGVMQDVSDKLLGQFVACLERRVVVEPADEPAGVPASAGEPQPSQEPAPEPTPPEDEAVAARPPQPEALDLGAAVLPALLRSAWKPTLATLLALVVALVVLRRLRGR